MFAASLGLFDVSSFPARWYCGEWSALHGWTHIISDIAIWGAYTAIPVAIVYFVSQRKDAPFPAIFWLFGAFILSCGHGHLVEAVIFWWPVYRLSATVKVVTAVVSWLTVFALIKSLPYALRLPGLEKVNTELAQANRELDDFAHVVSHDLRAPLRGIRTVASWIGEELKNEQGEIRENLALLDNRVAKMENLIDGILAYSRITYEEQPPTQINTQTLVQNLISEIEIPPHVKIRIQGSLPDICFAETKIYQIFLNLIDNAAKYCNPENGRIVIRGEEKRGGWEFEVADNGKGIPPEHRERVFKMFQRLDPEGQYPGSGLGLAVVKKIIEQAGGRIWIDTSAEGGAAFRFFLPNPEGL